MLKLIRRILTDKFSLLLAVGTSVVILYLSLMPTDNFPETMEDADKIYHLGAYVFLSFTWFFYFCIFKNIKKNRSFNIIAVFLIVFGIVIELIQQNFTDYRSFDWLDIVFNTLGILLVYSIFKHNKSKFDKIQNHLNV